MAEGGKTPEDQERPVERIVIDAPEFLAPGQNFLDQDPFREIVRKAVESGEIDLELLRRITLSAAQRIDRDLFDAIANRRRRFGYPGKRWSSEGRRQLYHLLKSVRQELDQYPDWYEYIRLQCIDSLYAPDGDWRPQPQWKNPEREVPRSYASWIARRQQLEHDTRILGIEEIFPQDLGEGTPPLRPEKGPGYRRWVIMRASEIGPK